MHKILQNISEQKSLDQVILYMVVFNLHLWTSSLKKFSLILIAQGELGSYSLLASGMKG